MRWPSDAWLRAGHVFGWHALRAACSFIDSLREGVACPVLLANAEADLAKEGEHGCTKMRWQVFPAVQVFQPLARFLQFTVGFSLQGVKKGGLTKHPKRKRNQNRGP